MLTLSALGIDLVYTNHQQPVHVTWLCVHSFAEVGAPTRFVHNGSRRCDLHKTFHSLTDVLRSASLSTRWPDHLHSRVQVYFYASEQRLSLHTSRKFRFAIWTLSKLPKKGGVTVPRDRINTPAFYVLLLLSWSKMLFLENISFYRRRIK